MNNDPLDNRLREAGWRRRLTEAENAELRSLLASHPEAQQEWEAEMALSDLLNRLPDAPVPSNFTSRVLQAVEKKPEPSIVSPGTLWEHLWQRLTHFAPAGALTALALSASVLSYHHFKAPASLAYARGVAAVSKVSSLPTPDILQDFEAIRALNHNPPPDETLLALMQ